MAKDSSYKDIFKSSFLVGGSQIITILIGIVKNKVLAMLLGPSGIGIMGIYTSIVTLIGSLSNLGINSSAVKFIAEAHGAQDQPRVNFLVKLIRRVLLVTGVITSVLMVVFSRQIALLSFGKDFRSEYVAGVGVIALMVLFDNLTVGERAILQGQRQLKSLALGQILGAMLGAILGVVIIYFFHFQGIAVYLLATSVCIYLVNRLQVRFMAAGQSTETLAHADTKQEVKSVIMLGLAFLISAVAGSIVAYIIRLLIVEALGVNGVGLYQSAWGLVNMSFNLVLVAMATDFYPRLVTVAADKLAVNKTVNEQVEISIIAALPILLALYVLSPFFLELLYSSQFSQANELTKWLAISCFFRVLCWPLGYIIIAKGRQNLFMITSIIWEVIHIPIILGCMHVWGLEGIGLSYVFVYAIVTLGATLITAHYFGFKWSRDCYRSIFIAAFIIILLVAADKLLPSRMVFYAVGGLAIVFSSFRFLYVVQSKFELNIVQKIRNKFRK